MRNTRRFTTIGQRGTESDDVIVTRRRQFDPFRVGIGDLAIEEGLIELCRFLRVAHGERNVGEPECQWRSGCTLASRFHAQDSTRRLFSPLLACAATGGVSNGCAHTHDVYPES